MTMVQMSVWLPLLKDKMINQCCFTVFVGGGIILRGVIREINMPSRLIFI